MLYTILCNIKPFLELFYFLSGIAIAICAIIALKQLKISKDAMKINAKRDSLKFTAEQCDNYIKNIHPLHIELNAQIEKYNVKLFEGWKVEIINDSIIFTNENNTVKNDAQPVAEIITNTLDAMEAFSNYFIFELADEEMAYSSVSSSFIAVVEKLMPVIFHFIKLGYYRNTVQLFALWKSRNDRHLLLINKEKLDEELSQLPNKCIVPIGA